MPRNAWATDSTYSGDFRTVRYQMAGGLSRWLPLAVMISDTNWSYGLLDSSESRIHAENRVVPPVACSSSTQRLAVLQNVSPLERKVARVRRPRQQMVDRSPRLSLR